MHLIIMVSPVKHIGPVYASLLAVCLLFGVYLFHNAGVNSAMKVWIISNQQQAATPDIHVPPHRGYVGLMPSYSESKTDPRSSRRTQQRHLNISGNVTGNSTASGNASTLPVMQPGAKSGEAGLMYLANYFSSYSCTSPVATKQSCIFHRVCFIPEGDKNLTVVRLQGSSATSTRGADALLKQQLEMLLNGVFHVHVFSHDEAMRDPAGKSNSKPGSRQNVPHKLWLGAVNFDGSSSRQPRALALTRTPTKGQKSSPALMFEDRLTVISKAGHNQVNQFAGNALAQWSTLFMT